MTKIRPVVEGGGWRKWWRILIFGGEWRKLSFFIVEKLGISGFFREKNIMKIGILDLFFWYSYITMWLEVAQSGEKWGISI